MVNHPTVFRGSPHAIKKVYISAAYKMLGSPGRNAQDTVKSTTYAIRGVNFALLETNALCAGSPHGIPPKPPAFGGQRHAQNSLKKLNERWPLVAGDTPLLPPVSGGFWGERREVMRVIGYLTFLMISAVGKWRRRRRSLVGFIGELRESGYTMTTFDMDRCTVTLQLHEHDRHAEGRFAPSPMKGEN